MHNSFSFYVSPQGWKFLLPKVWEFRRSVFVVLQLGFPGSLYNQVYISHLQKYVNALNKFIFSTLKMYPTLGFWWGTESHWIILYRLWKKIFKCPVTGRRFPFEQDVIGQIHNVEGMYLNHFGLQTEIGLGLFCAGFKLFFLLKTFVF